MRFRFDQPAQRQLTKEGRRLIVLGGVAIGLFAVLAAVRFDEPHGHYCDGMGASQAGVRIAMTRTRHQPFDEPAEVVAGGGEDGVGGVAVSLDH